ncbi:hypothetical protein [Haladaptatus sp. NG-WS-4]
MVGTRRAGLVFPAYFGLIEVSVSAVLRLALGLLVPGVGFTGMQVGVAMAVEKGIVSGGESPAAERG